MGILHSSSDGEDLEEVEQTSRTRSDPRTNTSMLLENISKTFEHWQEIILNMRENPMPEKDAQKYLYQEMVAARDSLNAIVEHISLRISTESRGAKIKAKHKNDYKLSKPEKAKMKFVSKPLDPQVDGLLTEYVELNKLYQQQTADLTERCASLKHALSMLDKEREDIFLRLSKLTSEQLTSNNPNVPDLSDPDRPTKLGEVSSDLYDDEWREAFEALLSGGRNERCSIRILLETFLDIFNFCKQKRSSLVDSSQKSVRDLLENADSDVCAKARLKRSRSIAITEPLREPDMDSKLEPLLEATEKNLYWHWMNKCQENKNLDTEDRRDSNTCVHDKQEEQDEQNSAVEELDKQLYKMQKDMNTDLQRLLKQFGKELFPVIEKAYLNTRWTSSCVKGLKPYIKKSLYVSWMMCVHTPPMKIHTSYPGDAFDTRLYNQYTLKGPYVDYIVWPALLLYEHGPVICKGVAQGKEA